MRENEICITLLLLLGVVNLILSIIYQLRIKKKSSESYCGCNSKSSVANFSSVVGNWRNKLRNYLTFNQDGTGNNSSNGKFSFTYNPSTLSGVITQIKDDSNNPLKINFSLSSDNLLVLTDPNRGNVEYIRE